MDTMPATATPKTPMTIPELEARLERLRIKKACAALAVTRANVRYEKAQAAWLRTFNVLLEAKHPPTEVA
jgi:hypothetical protein